MSRIGWRALSNQRRGKLVEQVANLPLFRQIGNLPHIGSGWNALRNAGRGAEQRTALTVRRARGLAMLEMVLSLPILLLLMALMINFGNVACWKVRRRGRAARRLGHSTTSLPPSAHLPNPKLLAAVRRTEREGE